MTSAVGHMTQAASERGGDLSDVQQQSAHIQKEHDRKDQELKMAELEKQDMQKQLDNVQSSCTYFQNKYKATVAETKKGQQEHAAVAEKATLLAQTAAAAQRESEQLRAQVGKLQRQLVEVQNSQHPDRQTQMHQTLPAASSSSSSQQRKAPMMGLAQVNEHDELTAFSEGRSGDDDLRAQQWQQQALRQQQQEQQQLQQQLMKVQRDREKEQQREQDGNAQQQQESSYGRPSLMTQLRRPGGF